MKVKDKFVLLSFRLLGVAFMFSFFSLKTNNSYGQASQSQCDNTDFFYGNFVNWQGFTGSCCPINTPTNGIVPGRHTVITTPGVDPLTCGGLQILPPGVPSVARLGDSNVGAQAERLRYQISPVTAGNALFIYNFAVVLESPGHSCSQQPRMQVRVTDQAGTLVDPNCASYNYAAGGCGTTAGSFVNCGGLQYQNWQTAALDLTNFIGQTINIDFLTGDCSLGGHFGYAYLYGECRALIIDVTYCSGSNQVSLEAPPGFATYQWYRTPTPATILGNQQTLLLSNPVVGEQISCRVTTFNGCVIILNSVIQPSIVAADFDFTTACAGELVNFYDLSSVNNSEISTWSWDFGDGTPPSLLQNPTHVFATGGVYPVTLTVGSTNGCTQSLTQNVTVSTLPQPQFNSPPICAGVPATFSNTTVPSTPISSYNWDFGYNNSVSLATNPSFIYPDPGTYNVSLTATDNNGCVGTTSGQVVVNPNPRPNFTVPPICAGIPATFTNTSTSLGGAITGMTWLFGTPPSVTGNNPTHTFFIPGNQNVTVSATDANGCVRDTIIQVTVNPLPQVSFTTTTACVGSPTNFTDGTVSAVGVASWSWDFGDNVGTDATPNPNYLYAAPGDYAATLTITDAIGCVNSQSQFVHVGNIPTADFNFQEACIGQITTFINASTSTQDPLFSYIWDFGTTPQTGSTAFNPVNAFLAPGTYDVTLTAFTNFNCASQPITKTITVHDIPVPDFTFTNVCAGFQTDFTEASSISSGSITEWNWTLNTAPPVIIPNSQNPSHTFAVGGNYSVTLTNVSDFGCSNSVTKNVQVYPNPIARFNFTTVCEGQPTSFNQNSAVSNPGNITTYTWDFNNGEGNSTNPNPVFIFGDYGTFPVRLEVETNHGCIDDTIRTVRVYSVPEMDFTFTNVCAGFPISFTNNTTNADGNFNSYWNFGTPIINVPYNTQTSPTVTYNTAGPYDVRLSATSSLGCSNELTQTINIYPNPVAYFNVPPTCLFTPAPFTDSSVVSNLFNDIIDQWSWNFGDGPIPGSSADQNPSYYYGTHGNYNVTLNISSNHGCVASTNKDVEILPVPLLIFSSPPACETHVNTFINGSQMPAEGLVSSWNWDFAGLSSSDEFEPTYLFPSAGTYSVTLSATTNRSCVRDTTIDVIVNPMPEVNFEANVLEGCQPLEVMFTDLNPNPTQYTVNLYQWSFGDAQYSNDPRPTNIYNNFGTFDVQLILTTTDGCKDSLTLRNYIQVFPKPIAEFSVDPMPAYELDAFINFTDRSLYEVNRWSWDFGVASAIDDISSEQNPQFLFPDTGTFYTTLYVENVYGCLDTIINPVVIRPEFIFYIPNAFTPQDPREDLNEVFNGYGKGIKLYDMKIYNRWGENIYHSKDPNLGWDGKLRKSNELAKQDVYVYVFEITDINNKFYVYRGHVTLIRSR